MLMTLYQQADESLLICSPQSSVWSISQIAFLDLCGTLRVKWSTVAPRRALKGKE